MVDALASSPVESTPDLTQPKTPINVFARRHGVDASTVWRWKLNGLAVNGRKVRLRTVKLGGRRFILESDEREFFAALNEPKLTERRQPAASGRRAVEPVAGPVVDLASGDALNAQAEALGI